MPTFDKLRVLNKTFKRTQINFSSDVFAAVVFAYSKLLAPLSALTFLPKRYIATSSTEFFKVLIKGKGLKEEDGNMGV